VERGLRRKKSKPKTAPAEVEEATAHQAHIRVALERGLERPQREADERLLYRALRRKRPTAAERSTYPADQAMADIMFWAGVDKALERARVAAELASLRQQPSKPSKPRRAHPSRTKRVPILAEYDRQIAASKGDKAAEGTRLWAVNEHKTGRLAYRPPTAATIRRWVREREQK
jgi:hypothetical protein